VGIVAVGMFAHQATYVYRGLFKPGHLLQTYNTYLTEIVADNAVITGPYAPALTIDNTLKSIIYMFGLSNVDKTLFADYPITHVAVEPSNWQVALKDFPQLKQATLVTEMVVRDQAIRLYRVADSTFPVTDFERATSLLSRNQPDSAKVYLQTFLQEHPQNLFGRMSMITATLGSADTVSAPGMLTQFVKDYSDNYFALAYALGMYQRLAGLTRSQKYLLSAEALRTRVTELNPYMPTGKVTRVGR